MKYVLLIIALCSPILITAQVPDIVQTAGIKTSLHKHNTGRIFFTNTLIPNTAITKESLIDSCALTNKSNLFFIAFMDNSLTNYLHQLLPGISADSLTKIGNYQFSLLVDNQTVYTSNLYPGAPYPKIQDTATIINRPFIDNEHGTGSWSESFWNRFLRNGGDSALTDGIHLLRMEIRPYIKTDSILTGKLIATGELKLNVFRNPVIDITGTKLSKVKSYDGFAVSTEHFDKNKIKELKEKIDLGIFKKVSSIIVIKNGKLLMEEYFNGENRNSLHDPRSVGKSFASTLTGMAIKDGYLQSEKQPLRDFYNIQTFNNYSREKENITIKDLLTMSSGLDGDDEDEHSAGNEENMYPTANWVKFALDLPFNSSRPKGQWHYFTAGVILLGDLLNKKVPGGLETYAKEKLFKPLNISNYQWEYTPQHVPNTAGGIRMNALDFAKYGQLYKNGGRWNGKQLIPKKWVAATLTRQKQIPGRDQEYYGYLFWNRAFKVNNQLQEAFYCAGNGGNYILIFKNLPLVIVITTTAYGQPYAHPQSIKILTDYILPAVAEKKN